MATLRKIEINAGVEYETYEYVWKLHNYPLVQANETRLAQQKFEMDVGRSKDVQSRWLVGLKGQGKRIMMYFRLLKKTGGDPKVMTRTSVGYKNGSSEAIVGIRSVENTTAQNEEFTVYSRWMFAQESSHYAYALENGTLTFSIKMELLAFQIEQSQNPMSCLQELKISSLKRVHCNYSKLLDDSNSHDTKIKCSDGVEIGAHKIILSAQNPVFASMFESDLSENRTGVINVEDVKGKTMKIILHYLYTGELLSEWSQPDTIVEFMYAAGKYQLAEVLEMLDRVLGNDDDSACNIVLLNLASKLSLKTAEETLMQRIVKLTNAAKDSKDLLAIFGNSDQGDPLLELFAWHGMAKNSRSCHAKFKNLHAWHVACALCEKFSCHVM